MKGKRKFTKRLRLRCDFCNKRKPAAHVKGIKVVTDNLLICDDCEDKYKHVEFV